MFPWPIDEEEEHDDLEEEHEDLEDEHLDRKTESSPSNDLKSKFAFSGFPMCFLVLLLPKFIQEEGLSMSIILFYFTQSPKIRGVALFRD